MADVDALVERIRNGPQGPKVGAFFDFDGTLIDGYSAAVVYRDRFRRRDVSASELGRSLVALLGMQLRGDTVDELIVAALAGLAGNSDDEMAAFGERLFRETIAGLVYPGARRLIAAHRAAGHKVVVATSATRYQVAATADDLGADDVLCTQAELDRDGVLTGGVDGRVLWGAAKADAVRDHCRRRKLRLTDSYGYGNGDEDEAFLRAVGRPAAVNPDDGLRRLAADQGWPVADLDPPGGRFGVESAVRTGAALGAMAAAFGVGVGVRLANRDKRMGANVATAIGSTVGLALGGVDVRIDGAEHVEAARPAVFVFNHQSGLDMLVIGKVVGHDLTGVAKQELKREPRFAPLGYLVDMAYVDRGDGRQAREAMAPAVDRLRAGTSIAIAPEGTRSVSPRLGEFKKGAFHLAAQAGVPIVPVVIRNAGELMWRSSFWLRPGRVDVRVLAPVDTSGWSPESMGDHAAEVRSAMERTLAEWD